MEATEKGAPAVAAPHSTKRDEKLSPRTRGKQLGDMDSYDLTILHFNDVYDVDSRSEEPVGGAARCGPPSSLSDAGGGVEGGDFGNLQEGLEAGRESFMLNLWGHCLSSLLDLGSNSVVLGKQKTELVSAQKQIGNLFNLWENMLF